MRNQSLSVFSLLQVRSQFLPYDLPWIGEEEVEAVVETLRSGWLTIGAKAGNSSKTSKPKLEPATLLRSILVPPRCI